jgi:hypothetical protein
VDPDQVNGPDPGGQKVPQKNEKNKEFSCFEVLDVLFWGLMASL